jgi:hypothetical protein
VDGGELGVVAPALVGVLLDEADEPGGAIGVAAITSERPGQASASTMRSPKSWLPSSR